ncbi:ORF243 [White spot syndrome virus]|uniref:ORF243 n=1 Tax=White spot syndrome virus TaxID=342409 RepID=A0A2D3I6Y8_9VIRU|nr:ORF243 [White spot syndrome virus]
MYIEMNENSLLDDVFSLMSVLCISFSCRITLSTNSHVRFSFTYSFRSAFSASIVVVEVESIM